MKCFGRGSVVVFVAMRDSWTGLDTLPEVRVVDLTTVLDSAWRHSVPFTEQMAMPPVDLAFSDHCRYAPSLETSDVTYSHPSSHRLRT